MLTGLLALAIAVMKLYPSTPLARSLHHWLVEWPMDALARLERRHLILVAILLFCGPSLAALGSAEVAMLYAVDLSLYADAVLMTSLSAIGVSLRKGWTALLVRMGGSKQRRPRARSRSTRASRSRLGTPSNDDEPAWAVKAA
jgi:hypothetical protein